MKADKITGITIILMGLIALFATTPRPGLEIANTFFCFSAFIMGTSYLLSKV